MVIRRALLIILLLVLFSPCLLAGNEAGKYLGKNRLKCFNNFLSVITKSHVISKDGLRNLGTTWDKELKRSKQRFLKASTKADVYYALLSLQRTLHDAHSKLDISKDFLPNKKRVELPIQFRAEYNNGKYEYAVVESNDRHVPVGSILKFVDGKTPEQIEYEFMEWLNSNSKDLLVAETARWLSLRDPKRMPSPDIGTETVYEFGEQGFDKEIKKIFKWAEYKGNGETDPYNKYMGDLIHNSDYKGYKPEFIGLNYIIYSTLSLDTKIIRYFSFYYKYNMNELWNRFHFLSYRPKNISPTDAYPWTELMKQDQSQMFEYLKRKNVKTILLDVRENDGGSFSPDFLTHFTDKSFNVFTRQLYYLPIFRKNPELLNSVDSGSDYMKNSVPKYFKSNPSARFSPLYPYECVTNECEISEAIYKPKNMDIKLNLVILSGPYCVSSCDHLVAVAKDNKIGKVIGVPSRGGEGAFRLDAAFFLANKTKFTISTSVGATYRLNGLPLEAHPAEVDKIIRQTKENRKTYLQEALSHVTN